MNDTTLMFYERHIPIEFIKYYTGDSSKTILDAYQTWLIIKDSDDYDIFHSDPDKNKQKQ